MDIGPKLVEKLAGIEAFDGASKAVIKQVSKAVRPRMVRNLASGTVVGHPMHPMLTDLPIGAWTMSTLLDLIGGRSSRRAADLLVKVGIASALPTVATGLNDWSDTYGPETRIGFVHAAVNSTALGLYLLSSRSRSRGHRARAKLLGLLGFGVLLGGSYLGGQLSFVKGVNVNRTAWEEGPTDWTAALADADLPDGEHRAVTVGGVRVLLYRSGGEIFGLANTCSHMGGPLDEGGFADGCVTCPWHGSTFRLRDGAIVRGPASTAQPVYEARVVGDQIEVRTST